MSVSIPPEPTPEILEVLYGGLYRLDTNFGKIRAKTRYRKMVAMLQQQESFEPTTRSDDVFLRGEMNENY